MHIRPRALYGKLLVIAENVECLLSYSFFSKILNSKTYSTPFLLIFLFFSGSGVRESPQRLSYRERETDAA